MSNKAKASPLRAKIIASAQNFRRERVTLQQTRDPKTGAPFVVEFRGLSAERAHEIREASREEQTPDDVELGRPGKVDENRVRLALVIATMHDPETGDPVWGDADRDLLMSFEYPALHEMVYHAERVAGGRAAEEDARKNSETPAATSDAPSGSPSASGE